MRFRLLAVVAAVVALTFSVVACGYGPGGESKVVSKTSINGSPCGPTTIDVPLTASASGWNAKADVKNEVNINLAPCRPPCPSDCDAVKPPAPKPAPRKVAPPKKATPPPPPAPCDCAPKQTASAPPQREEFVMGMPPDIDAPGKVLMSERRQVQARLAQATPMEAPVYAEPKTCRGRKCR